MTKRLNEFLTKDNASNGVLYFFIYFLFLYWRVIFCARVKVLYKFQNYTKINKNHQL